MSGLSSLAGIPSPVKRTGASEAAESKGANLTSLSNAPSLSGRASRPSSSAAEPEAAKRSISASKARPSATPAGNNSDDEDDESLYPRARRLVKDTPRKPASAAASQKASKAASKDSSDDDVPASRGAARPTSAAAAAGSGSSQRSGNTTGRAPAGSSKASNPILAMLDDDDDDDDDDFLKSLAPPKKETSPTPAARTAGRGATREGPGHRSASPHSGMGGRGVGGGAAGASRGSTVGRSMDTLSNFLKDDEPGLEISLNMGDDGGDALDVLGGPKPAAAPKQGRRRGGPQGSTPGTGDVSPVSGQISPSGVPGGSTQPFPLSERQKFTDEVGRGVQEARLPAYRQGVTEPEPSMRQQGAQQGPQDSDDEDLGGLKPPLSRGPASHPPPPPPAPAAPSPKPQAQAPPPPAPPVPAPTPAPAPATRPPAPAAPLPRHAGASDSWDLDADSMLPDESEAPAAPLAAPSRGHPPAASPRGVAGGGGGGGGADGRAGRGGGPGSTAQYQSLSIRPPLSPVAEGDSEAGASPPMSTGPVPGVQTFHKSASMVERPPPQGLLGGQSLLPQPSGPRSQESVAPTPVGAGSGADREEGEEGTGGYMPSFAGGARAKSPLAGRRAGGGILGTGAAASDGQRQRRPVPAGGSGGTQTSGASPARTLDKGPLGGSLGRNSQPSPARRAPFGKGLSNIFESSTDDDLPDFLSQPRLGARPAPVRQPPRQPAAVPAGPSPASAPPPPAPAPPPQATARPLSPPVPETPAALEMQQVPSNNPGPPPPLQLQPPPQPQQQQQQQRRQGLPPGVVQPGPPLGPSSATIPPNFVPLGPSGPPPGIVPLGTQPPPGVQGYGSAAAAGAQPPPGLQGYSSATAAGAQPQLHVSSSGGGKPAAPLLPWQLAQQQQQQQQQQLGYGPAGDGGMGGGVDGDSSMYKHTRHDYHSHGNEDRRWLQEENAKLRVEVAQLEAAVKEKGSLVNLTENKLAASEAHAKIALAESQALAMKEAAALRRELEDAQQALERIRSHYAESESEKNKEVARIKEEKEQAITAINAELVALRQEAVASAAAAEARGKRLGAIEKEVAEAQMKAQQASLAEEKEVVLRHRLSSDILAELADKIRTASSTVNEREERTLYVLERDVKDREARVASREKLLSERESRIAERERELDALRADLQSLSATLENAAIHQREDIHREQVRLGREALRIDAIQGTVLAEREDLRVQVAMERKLLEEAREARRREREHLIDEVASERRTIAAEYADTLRRLDAARTEMLQLKNRLVEYEARANAALQQAVVEEERLEKVSKAASMKQDMLDAAFKSVKDEKAALETEAKSLIEYAERLEAQSSNLAASSAQLEASKLDFDKQRQEYAMEAAHIKAAKLQAEENQRQVNLVKQGLDHERVSIAQERRTLAQERLDASKAVDASREAQRKLAEAVRGWVTQGVPIPFSVDLAPGGDLQLGPLPSAPLFSVSPSKMAAKGDHPYHHQHKEHRALRGGHYSKARAQSGGMVGSPGRGRNSLKHELGRLSRDAKQGVLPGTGHDYIRQQKEFLVGLNMPASLEGIQQLMDADLATLGITPASSQSPHAHHPILPSPDGSSPSSRGVPLGLDPQLGTLTNPDAAFRPMGFPLAHTIAASPEWGGPIGTHTFHAAPLEGRGLRAGHAAPKQATAHRYSSPRSGSRPQDVPAAAQLQQLGGVPLGVDDRQQEHSGVPRTAGAAGAAMYGQHEQSQRQQQWSYGHAMAPTAQRQGRQGAADGAALAQQPKAERQPDVSAGAMGQVSTNFTPLLPVSGSSSSEQTSSSGSSRGGNKPHQGHGPPLPRSGPGMVGAVGDQRGAPGGRPPLHPNLAASSTAPPSLPAGAQGGFGSVVGGAEGQQQSGQEDISSSVVSLELGMQQHAFSQGSSSQAQQSESAESSGNTATSRALQGR